MSMLVPVLRSRFVSRTKKISYVPLNEALENQHATDAVTAAWSLPLNPHRLVTDNLDSYAGVRMVLLIVDVDDEAAHKSENESTDEWWKIEVSKIDALLTDRPNGFVYRTRAGYRVLYKLGKIFVIHNINDKERWKSSYLAVVDYLNKNHGISADKACADWTHLYRLPHGTRDGQMQRRETIGDPNNIGHWDLDIVEPAPTRSAKEIIGSATESILGQAFVARQMAGREISQKLHVKCPWYEEHSPHPPLDGSTVIMAPTGEHNRGWYHCSHSHCVDRKQADVCEALGIDESPNLARLKSQLAETVIREVVTLENVVERVGKIITNHSPKDLTNVRLSLGGGKTHAAVQAVTNDENRYVISVPTHQLASEIEARINDHGVEVDRRRGVLKVVGADGESLCKQRERGEQLQAAGGSIPRLLCPTCPHASGCPARMRSGDERIIVTPHQLAAVAMSRKMDVRPSLIVDECPELLREVVLTERDLLVAVNALYKDILVPSFAREIEPWLRALAYALRDPQHDLIEACSYADDDCRITDVDEWTNVYTLSADSIRKGAGHGAGVRILRIKDLLSLAEVQYKEALNILRIFKAIVASQDITRIAWRPNAIAVHVDTDEAALLQNGALLLDATPPIELLKKLRPDLQVIDLHVEDAQLTSRTILLSNIASRSKLAPKKVVKIPIVQRLITRALSHLPSAGYVNRVLLVTHKPIADALRTDRLLAKYLDKRVDVAHYGSIRGLDKWKDFDACITLGDPYPTLETAREQAELLGLDRKKYPTEIARNELAQAHGRLRDPSRSAIAFHIHVGAIAPAGWTTENTQISTPRNGRPTTKKTVTKEQLTFFVALHGGQRATARKLGIPRKTLQNYLSGRHVVPAGLIPKSTKSPTGVKGTPKSHKSPTGVWEPPKTLNDLTCTPGSLTPIKDPIKGFGSHPYPNSQALRSADTSSLVARLQREALEQSQRRIREPDDQDREYVRLERKAIRVEHKATDADTSFDFGWNRKSGPQ